MKRRVGRPSRRRIVVLGPQRTPTVGEALADLEAEGHLEAGAPIASVTAGWQEREEEVAPLSEAAGRPAIDLGLYRRSEALAVADPELAREHSEVQNRLKELRRAYNVRLRGLFGILEGLAEIRGSAEVLDAERRDALESVRRLDARHLARAREVREEFEDRSRPAERPSVVKEREAIATLLADTAVVAVAGGHVATLLNRLRLFGFAELIGDRPVIAWSAGAMALARRVVLFHDSPPWGPGHAEAFENGLGLIEGLVALPHASERLNLDDPVRTARLARRFAPDACALLDPGARLDLRKGRWRAAAGTRRLDGKGSVVPYAQGAA